MTFEKSTLGNGYDVIIIMTALFTGLIFLGIFIYKWCVCYCRDWNNILRALRAYNICSWYLI